MKARFRRALLRVLWRLYPPRWRARFRPDLERSLDPAAPPPRRWVRDALRTLPRAWWATLADPVDGPGPFDAVRADARSAWRAAWRAPAHAALVVATLGLALGVNGAVFGLTWSALVDTLPYDDAERIVEVEPSAHGGFGSGGWVPDPEFMALPEIEAAALYYPDGGANLVGADASTRIAVTQIGEGFFEVLGVDPALGRFAAPEPVDGQPEAVLAHGLWIDAFGGDPGVVGATVRLSGHAYTVVGVAPPGVDFPAGTRIWASTPLVYDFYGTALGPEMLARLTSVEAAAPATAALARLQADWNEGRPDHLPDPPPARLIPLRDRLVGALRTPLYVLGAAAGAVLLLGCLNLAGIQLARVASREGELAVRRALGAGRGRLARQLLLEVALLAGAASVASLVLAVVARRVLESWLPPVASHPGSGLPVAAFAFLAGAGGLAALGVGLLPALRAARASGRDAVTRRATADPAHLRLRGLLVVGQVAVAVTLAVGAGLLARSLAELHAVPLGYDTESVLTFRVHLPSDAYPDAEAHEAYARTLLERLEGLPGVETAGYASRLPLASGMGLGMSLRTGPSGEPVVGSLLQASDGFFRTMGIRFVAGGPPTPPDSAGQDLGGLVIDRSTARRLFGRDAPLGERLEVLGRSPVPALVAGVVEDLRLRGPGSEARPVVYSTTRRAWLQQIAFAVSTGGAPGALAGPVRAAAAELDPTVPAWDVQTTRDALDRELSARRAVARLSALFGAAGLGLVALGLFGTVAGSVAARRRELGIRMALGARVEGVVGSTVGRALALVGAGAVLGLGGAALLTDLLQGLLFGVRPGDPRVMAAVVALTLLVGLAAAFVPAARAGRIDPAEALRSD